jgi:hypothetical protein
VLKPRNSKQWYGEFFAWLQRHDAVAAKTGAVARKRTKQAATRASG